MKQLFSILICACLLAGTIHASDLDALAGADISIRFHNRTIYYPGSSGSDPIYVQVTITNNGTSTLRFKLADNHFFSIDFSAVTTRNQPLDHSQKWLSVRNSNAQVYFREISIEPSESYSFVEDIKDYLDILTPGMFVLDCSLYPELVKAASAGVPLLKSNKLTLEIKPSPGPAAISILPVSPVTAEPLQAQPIPPDEVITYMLTARQKSWWNQFFLYLDLEKMLENEPVRAARFRAESEAGRFTMIENYKTELMQAKVSADIAVVPVDFAIERTTYTKNEATVVVTEWFDYRTFREIKRYTYYLSNKNGIWKVYRYTVDNLGTE